MNLAPVVVQYRVREDPFAAGGICSISQNKSLYESWAHKLPRSIVNGRACRPRSKSSRLRGRPITSARLVGSATKSFGELPAVSLR
jgi:hypothetical protein